MNHSSLDERSEEHNQETDAPDDQLTARAADRLREQSSQDGMEALTPDELEDFLRRARERAAQFGEADGDAVAVAEAGGAAGAETDEVQVVLAPERLLLLSQQFFPELPQRPRPRRLVQGVVFDFDNTLARLKRPLDELMEEGARTAEAYMRSTGMVDLPDELWKSIIEARVFAETKSDDEQEEHVANDTLSFLLQFVGYPASRMDLDVLHRAVDLFYAPEMTAWEPMPGAVNLLTALREAGYRLALIANYSCDRAFQRIVEYTGLRQFMDVCLCSAAVEWRKPGVEIYGPVLKRWDVEPYELVCVGDSLKHDVSGGLTLGAQTVHVRQIPLAEDQRIVDAVSADATIDRLDRLFSLVQEWS